MSLEVKKLDQILSGNKILKNINVHFSNGKLSVISGPNGSGKTTLLKSIMKLHPVENEKIYLNNIDINSINIRKRAQLIGYVPQFSNSDFDFTVYETIEMGRYPFRFQWNNGDDEKAVNRAMELTGMSCFKERQINSLSGGELQRVLLARALAVNPKYLILDEPSSNLDISHNIEMMKIIKDITKELNITTIMVLHDINTIYKYADKVILLESGKLMHKGTPKKVLNSKNIKEIFGVESEFVKDTKGIEHIIINPLV